MIDKVFKRIKEAEPCDFLLLALTTILVIFGIVMIFSASYYDSLNSDGGSPYYYLKRQIAWAVIGFILMYVLSYVDYHMFRKYSIVILVISLLLLGALFTPLGTTVNEATRWIRIGPISIMPGEIAKFAMICFVSAYFAADIRKIKSLFKGIVPMVLLTGLFAGLIVVQPNLSTALTLCGIVAAMMFIAGMQWRYVWLLIAGLIGGLVLILNSDNYQAVRMRSFIDPFKDAQGDGWQVVQSLLALGTGGLRGLGLGKSVQKNLYLPEPQNDFILAIIGEELGFIGIMILLAVFIILVWRGLMIAMKAPDKFGMLFASGAMMMIGIQVVLNVAVVTSSMPPTGIALPFISYGGNSLWIIMGSIGVVLNISRQSQKDTEQLKEPRRRRKTIKAEGEAAA
ncbi:MAG: putative lipid II flippase FtsW [Eubacterium sp.]|nr:putative lipid II flippase FtsW [Eubacterium sp.]